MCSNNGRVGARIAQSSRPKSIRTRTATLSLLTQGVAFALVIPVAVAADDAAGQQSDGGPAPYETVVVAPARLGEEGREDGAASSSVITADRTPRSAESLPQLLAELPGVAVTRLGGLGAFATLSIRGSSSNQVLVYLDGVPLNSASGGGVDLGLVALGALERIEVYRGMSPLAFGASALGGIVSLTTEVPRASGAEVQAGLGSFGARFGGVTASAVSRRIRVLANLQHLQSTGDFVYPDDNGTAFDSRDDHSIRRSNNQVTQTDGLVRGAVPLPGRRQVLASLSFLHREQGVPGSAVVDSHETSLGTRRFIASASYQSRDDLGASGRIRAQAFASLTEQQFRDPRGEIALVPTHTHDRTTAGGATLTATGALAAWIHLSALADARQERFEPFDEEGTDPASPPGTRSFGAFGIEPMFLVAAGAIEVRPSLRLEVARDVVTQRSLSGLGGSEPFSAAYALPLGRLAIGVWATSWCKLRGNVGRYARLPSLTERYGNSAFIIGNAELVPETSLNLDLGMNAAWGTAAHGATLDLAVFGARVRDLIHFQQNGQGRMRARNIGRARVVGVELAAEAHLTRYARLVAQATFTDARDVSTISGSRGHQLPHRPRLRAYGRPELRRLPLFSEWTAGFYGELDATGGNHLDAANLVAVPARVLFGAGAFAEAPRSTWRLVASAQNLGDSRINDLAGFPLPGRSLFFTLQWSLNNE